MAKKFSRRNLFRIRLGDLSDLIADGLNPPQEQEEEVEKELRFRPPGALTDETAFASACDRCKLCSEACPYGVILHEGVVSGTDEGLPYLELEKNPCRWCVDMPCIKACPSGALRLGPEGKVAPIARARLNMDTCLANQGIICDTCSYRCPTSVKAIRMDRRLPVFDEDACVGCGLCNYHCDSEPSSYSIIHIVDEA